MKKKSLCLIINADWYFKLHWLERALLFQEQFKIKIISNFEDYQFKKSLIDMGFEVYDIPLSRRGISIIKEINLFYQLYRLISKISPDIVHNVTIKPNIYAGIIAKIKRIPCVGTITGLGEVFDQRKFIYKVLRPLVKFAYMFAYKSEISGLVFENDQNLEKFRKNKIISTFNSLRVKGAGVDINKYNIVPAPSTPPNIILFASRLLREKGLEELIMSINRLRQKGHEIVLNVAGIFDNSKGAISPKEINLWHKNGDINWIGTRDDMHEIIKQSNIICLPTTYGEGLPRILIEGAACGRALVASNVVGCNDLIRHNENGLLFDPSNMLTLDEALEKLILDIEFRKRLGERARKDIEDGYSVESIANEFLSFYKKVAN